MSQLLCIADKMDECEEWYQKYLYLSNTMPADGLLNLLFGAVCFKRKGRMMDLWLSFSRISNWDEKEAYISKVFIFP